LQRFSTGKVSENSWLASFLAFAEKESAAREGPQAAD
jgi:hypothetical protein